jgi:hypothetical protein
VVNTDIKFGIRVKTFVPHPEFVKQAGKCVRVEYDLDYYGGDYSKVGQFAYIPHAVVDKLTGMDMDKKLARAFEMLVGDPRHIIHFTWDEAYDQDGNEWKDEK